MNVLQFMNRGGAAYVIISRLGVMAVGLGVALLAPAMLTAVEQGYFFTFLSLAALQGIFELGINTLMIQHFAHIKGQLCATGATLPEVLLRTAGQIKEFSQRYFRRAAVLFVLLVGTGGALFFLNAQGLASLPQWGGPWVVLLLGVALSLLNVTRFAIAEGFGLIKECYLIRFHVVLVMFACFCAALFLFDGLYAHPLALLVSQLYGRRRVAAVLERLPSFAVDAHTTGTFDFADLKKTQRKFAVSAIAGFFTANSITPYVFHFFGPVVAGQVGLTVSVFYAAASLAMAFSTADAPRYGQWISQGKNVAVYSAWKRNVVFSLAAAGSMSLMLLGANYLLEQLWPQYSHRVMNLQAFAFLSLLIVVNTSVTTVSTVLRSFRTEDLMWPSLWGAVVSFVLQFGVHLPPSQYFLGMAAYNGLLFLPFAYVLMRQKIGVLSPDR